MVTLQLIATLTDGTNPLSSKTIKFYYSYDGVTYNLISSEVTDSYGQASITHETEQTTWYKAVFEGDDAYAPSEAEQKYTIEVIIKVLEVGTQWGVYIWSVTQEKWLKAGVPVS